MDKKQRHELKRKKEVKLMRSLTFGQQLERKEAIKARVKRREAKQMEMAKRRREEKKLLINA